MRALLGLVLLPFLIAFLLGRTIYALLDDAGIQVIAVIHRLVCRARGSRYLYFQHAISCRDQKGFAAWTYDHSWEAF